jgi:hypothetical protein
MQLFSGWSWETSNNATLHRLKLGTFQHSNKLPKLGALEREIISFAYSSKGNIMGILCCLIGIINTNLSEVEG